MDRGAGRHQRDRHRAGRGEPRSSCSPPSTSRPTAPVVLHGRADPRPAHRRAARHRRRERPGDDACTRRSSRWSRRPSGSPRRSCGGTTSNGSSGCAGRGAVLASVAGPLLLVDDHGWVAHTAGIAAQARIAVPRAERPLTVPGPRPVPARAGRGRLAGPARRARETRIVMTLDLTGRPRSWWSGERPWRTPLTARHAEILRLLHRAGRSGLTAAALSQAPVRRRRARGRGAGRGVPAASVLGGVVESQPYRISAAVELGVLEWPRRRSEPAQPSWRATQVHRPCRRSSRAAMRPGPLAVPDVHADLGAARPRLEDVHAAHLRPDRAQPVRRRRGAPEDPDPPVEVLVDPRGRPAQQLRAAVGRRRAPRRWPARTGRPRPAPRGAHATRCRAPGAARAPPARRVPAGGPAPGCPAPRRRAPPRARRARGRAG